LKLNQVVSTQNASENNREKNNQREIKGKCLAGIFERNLQFPQKGNLRNAISRENQRIFILLRPWADFILDIMHYLSPPLFFFPQIRKLLEPDKTGSLPLNNFWKA
jgi:hypothetical protein